MIWNGKDVRITAFVENAPEPKARFTITTDIGSFGATRLTDNAWEVCFTDNSGEQLTFRTSSSELLMASIPGNTHPEAQRGTGTAPERASGLPQDR